MKWYLVKIVFRIICGDGNHTPQFDEQLRLLKAGATAEAIAQAETIGRQEEDIFCNDKQQLVQWKFVGVSELHHFGPLLHGAELYSQIKEADDADAYINFVRYKAEGLRKRSMFSVIQTT